ncbi:MAG: ribonuclease HII [Ignavibacteriae bacterium]|nr:ribonuclease HII [Ignavibacteriota bacterium]
MKKFDLKYLSKDITILAGVDEVGRGPLAGSVVAATVIFDNETIIEGVNDSKQLSEKERERLSEIIKEKCLAYSFGVIDQNEIDEINILQATLKAMKQAVDNLSITPQLILIDGNKSFVTKTAVETIVKGDSKSFSIAAASILAKVKRDKMMKKAATKYPEYFWEKNKGYGTKQHIDAIKKHGITPLHRKTFLKKILSEEVQEVLF